MRAFKMINGPIFGGSLIVSFVTLACILDADKHPIEMQTKILLFVAHAVLVGLWGYMIFKARRNGDYRGLDIAGAMIVPPLVYAINFGFFYYYLKTNAP